MLGVLDAIEKSGQDVPKVLTWRPGPGRAHVAWQAMHCAATLDRYINGYLRQQPPQDPDLIARYAGGTTPADDDTTTLADIRTALAKGLEYYESYVASLAPEDLPRVMTTGSTQRTIEESLTLLAWHETHHQGQIHLTWNLYKAQ